MLFLYSKNISEYPESSLLIPLIIAFIFTLVVYGMMQIVFRRIERAAIVSSIIIFITLSYGRFLTIFAKSDVQLFGLTISHEYLVFTGSMLVLVAVIFFVRRFKSLLQVNKLFLLLSVVLLVFPVITIISFEARTGRVFKIRFPSVITTGKTSQTTKNLPDIYYFIFDRYAGPKSQRTEYGIENNPLFEFLKRKGFYLAEDASTNYPKTLHSLGSSLNMEYLDFLTEKTNGGHSSDQTIVTPLIRQSKVHMFLKNKGYYLVNIGPKTWNPTSKNPYADQSFIMKNGTYGEADAFTTGFLNTTIAAPLLKKLFHNPLDVSADPENNEHRRLVLFGLEAVEKAIDINGPKFVFAHILIPHDPFVFDKNCNPITEEEVKKHDHVYNYKNQLTCANTNIEKLMTDILARSKTPPIILLQSDEGPFPLKNILPEKQSWSIASTEALKEKFPILNAFYMPGVSQKELYQSITPVNSFRVIFNSYFDTKLPLLPDRNYVFQDEENYYKFTDVTERIK